MPVRSRLDIEGPNLFFVTTTVVHWTPLFARDDLARTVLSQLAERADVFRASVAGYVLMPSHLHVLLGLRDGRFLSRFMQSFKSLSSRKLKRMDLGRFADLLQWNNAFAVWQRGFDDLVLASERQFRIKLEYIHNNPTKAGLVKTATEYFYSSACDWIEGKQGLVAVDKSFAYTE